MSLLQRVNAVLTREFPSLDDLLAYYRLVLPERTAGYHQEEVGPVMHHEAPGEADKFVAKIFTLGEHTVDMSQGLDWFTAPDGDLEWNGGLVRHGYFTLLAEAYARTGEEKYATAVVEHLLDYVRRVPRFDPAGRPYLAYKKSTWRPFEVAGRAAETWPEALGKIITSAAVTPEAWAEILLATYDHADFLRLHHWRTGNHACLEVAALGLLGLFYEEFREAASWREYAVDFLMKMWPEQFHPDGYTKEMSGGYHWVAMRSFFTFYEVAVRRGFRDIFPPAYRERLALAAAAELYQDKPDFSVPITNDSNTKTNRREQLVRLNELLHLPAVEFVLTGGRHGTAPERTSFFFPEARVGVMRSDWSPQARYLFFDMGRWGENHMNEDQLHIEVSAYGRKFLAGCGRWRYTTSPDAPWMKRAKYFKTTAAYNSLLVDGYSQVAADADGRMISTIGFDYAEGVFAGGYGEEAPETDDRLFKEKGIANGKIVRVADVTHRRQVFFARPDFWIVRDILSGKGEHTAEQVWHFYDGELEEVPVPGGRGFVTRFPDNNLFLMTTGTNEVTAETWLGAKDPFRGWHCPYYDQMRPAPEVSFRQHGRDEIVFHTLIFPVEGEPGEIPSFTATVRGYEVKRNGELWRVDTPAGDDWRMA